MASPVFGNSNTGIGVHGDSNSGPGVHGSSNRTGVSAVARGIGTGVHGHCDDGTGVFGFSRSLKPGGPTGIGVHGHSERSTGVFGCSNGGSGWGVHGASRHVGVRADGHYGVQAVSQYFAAVDATGGGAGVLARATGANGVGVSASGARLAGDFGGDVYVSGTIKGNKLKGGHQWSK